MGCYDLNGSETTENRFQVSGLKFQVSRSEVPSLRLLTQVVMKLELETRNLKLETFKDAKTPS